MHDILWYGGPFMSQDINCYRNLNIDNMYYGVKIIVNKCKIVIIIVYKSSENELLTFLIHIKKIGGFNIHTLVLVAITNDY